MNATRGLSKRFAKSWKQLHTVFKQGDGIASFEAQVRMSDGHGLTLSKRAVFIQSLHHWNHLYQQN